MSYFPFQVTKFFDSPGFIDASATPIPDSGSSPLQVIADSGPQTSIGIHYNDSTGDFVGVYFGAVGAEKLACIIGNGQTSTAWGTIPARSRVSIRSMTTSQITSGKLTASLVTQ